MKVEQVWQATNAGVKQAIGETIVLEKDLSNIVDVGNAVIGADALDNYVKGLQNHIGKVITVQRVYKGEVPSVLMDSWEFGSILEKIKIGLPEATQNDSWKLEDGVSYDPNVFNAPDVSAKFFNSKTTFEIDMSFTEMQVKESFSSAEQLAGFISGIETAIQNALTMRFDSLVKDTINSLTADTLHAASVGDGNDPKAVNLLALYQAEKDETLVDPAEAIQDPEFIRFATLKMRQYQARLRTASKLFNIGGNTRFTPDEMLHVVMLNDFKAAAEVYLQSDTYHDEFTALPNSETVNFWQGSGLGYDFDSVSKINVTSGAGNQVEQSGIIAVMFDRDAVGVTNMDRRVTTHYNARAEFYNNFYKADASYFTDGDENFVVFYVDTVA